jgi:hypothetical protein
VGTGPEFDSSTLDLPTGQYTLKVKVIDNTEMVRDEGKRATDMNEVRTWTLREAGHWKFDDGGGGIAEDSIGDNDGNLIGNPQWVDGYIGGALDFDGDGDYVSLSDMNSLADNTTTIAAWIKADDLSENYNPIVTQCKKEGIYYYGYSFYVDGDGNKPTFYLGGNLAQSSEAINEGSWYHLAGTYDGSTLKIYVNGVQRGTKTSSKSGCHHKAYIGYDDVIDADFFSGLIDDVRVYDWAMDLSEIWEVMVGSPKFCIKNSSGERMAWFTNIGNLALKGTLEEESSHTATGHDEFRFQDSEGEDVAIIDATNGEMYIDGEKYVNQAQLNPPANSFIIKNKDGYVVAYIDVSGDLYLKRKLYENAIP